MAQYPYLRNKPTKSNNATNPANPDCPNSLIIAVRLPITFTPKTPLPKRTSDIAPTAKKDVSRCTISSIQPLTCVMASFMCYLHLFQRKRGPLVKSSQRININIFLKKSMYINRYCLVDSNHVKKLYTVR